MAIQIGKFYSNYFEKNNLKKERSFGRQYLKRVISQGGTGSGSGGGASEATLRAAEAERDELLRDNARYLEINVLSNNVLEVWRVEVDKGEWDLDQKVTVAKAEIFKNIYFDKGEINDNPLFWTELDKSLEEEDEDEIKTAFGNLATEIKGKTLETSRPEMEANRLAVLNNFKFVVPVKGAGKLTLKASDINKGTWDSALGGTIDLPLVPDALKSDSFSLEKIAKKPLTGADVPQGVRIELLKMSLKNDYDNLVKKLRKDSEITFLIERAENIAWNDGEKIFVLNETVFTKFIVEQNEDLKAKVDNFRERIQKIIANYNTSKWDANVEINKRGSGVGHWNDATRGDGTWSGYLDAVDEETDPTNKNDLALDFAISNITMGMLEAVVPELIKRNLEKPDAGGTKVSKTEMLYFMNNWVCDGFWKKPHNDLFQAIDSKYTDRSVEYIVNSLTSDKANEWTEVLNRINTFINTATTITAIENEANNLETEYGKPLDGINFKGFDLDDLQRKATNKKLSDYGLAEADLEPEKDDNENHYRRDQRWLEYTAIESETDGNSFLNSIALLLTGNEDDSKDLKKDGSQSNVAIRLRAGLCLDMMRNHRKYNDFINEKGQVDFLKGAINKVQPKPTVDEDEPTLFSKLLERPIGVIRKKISSKSLDVEQSGYDEEISQRRPFDILKTSDKRFLPLIPTKENNSGRMVFTPDRIIWNDSDPQIRFEFSGGSFHSADMTGLIGFEPLTAGKFRNDEYFPKLPKDEQIHRQKAMVVYYNTAGNKWIKKMYEEATNKLKRANKAGRGQAIVLDIWKAFVEERNSSIRTGDENETIHMGYQNVVNVLIKKDWRKEFVPLVPFGADFKVADQIEPEFVKDEIRGFVSSVGVERRTPEDKIKYKNSMPRGSALLVHTRDGRGIKTEGVDNVIHACSGSGGGDLNLKPSLETVILSVQNTIILAERNNYPDIAIPLIGGNIFKSMIARTSEEIARAVVFGALHQRTDKKLKIVFVDWDKNYLQEALDNFKEEIVAKGKSNELFENVEVEKGDEAKGGIQTKALHGCSTIVNAANLECKLGGGGGTAGTIAKAVLDYEDDISDPENVKPGIDSEAKARVNKFNEIT